jgi:hypothetical protein
MVLTDTIILDIHNLLFISSYNSAQLYIHQLTFYFHRPFPYFTTHHHSLSLLSTINYLSNINSPQISQQIPTILKRETGVKASNTAALFFEDSHIDDPGATSKTDASFASPPPASNNVPSQPYQAYETGNRRAKASKTASNFCIAFHSASKVLTRQTGYSNRIPSCRVRGRVLQPYSPFGTCKDLSRCWAIRPGIGCNGFRTRKASLGMPRRRES